MFTIKKKTLIICNRVFLMEQWKKEIQEFLIGPSIGWLQGSKYVKTLHIKRKRQSKKKQDIQDTQDTQDLQDTQDTQDVQIQNEENEKCEKYEKFKKFEKYDVEKDIVIASIESLSRCEQNKEELKKFSLVIVDEMHHLGSKTLSQILQYLPARYILGVTATPYRQDTLEHVLYWLCGPTSFVYKRIPAVTGHASKVSVQSIQYCTNELKLQLQSIPEQKTLYSTLCNILKNNEIRNTYILDLIQNCKEIKKRNKILIVTSFVDHGTYLQEKIQNVLKFSCEFLHGGVKQDKILFAKSLECSIVIATYQYMEEGYDDPTLDTLILSVPRSNVQQVIGRCERTHEGKLDPLIIDIVDTHFLFQAMHKKRKKFYTNQQYNII